MTTENPLTAIDAKWLNSIWGWHLTSIKTLNEEYLERRQQRQPVVAGCMLLPVDIWAAATSVAAATAAAATKKKGTFAATPKSGVFRWERLLHRNPGQLGRDLTSCRSGPELCNNRTGSGPQICKSRVTGDVTLRGWTTRRTAEQSDRRRLDFLVHRFQRPFARLVVELNPSMMVQHSARVRCPGKVVMDAHRHLFVCCGKHSGSQPD